MNTTSKNSLTVIIPFLNEGMEVEHTLQSIRATAGDSVEIVIINDGSTDEFDYEKAALKHNAHYHKNEERLGIAASRDLGISMIETPYFLLLDGHMRFYNSTWVDDLTGELKKNEKVLLCCQVKQLSINKAGQLKEENHGKPHTWGAYINFHNSTDALRVEWIRQEASFVNSEIADIPCILGASYAANKSYWQYLRGLEGLKYYGSDEEYISIKVWREGGNCKLMNNIVVGHVFRRSFPYNTDIVYRVYNKLWIAELLLSTATKNRVNYLLKKFSISKYIEANELLIENIAHFRELKSYYKQILSHDFGLIKDMNKPYNPDTSKRDALFLDTLASTLIQEEERIPDSGLFYGKMGVFIFLFHYARHKKDEALSESIRAKFHTYLRQLNIAALSNTFDEGLWGIGWGLMYLQKQGFIDNINALLSDIDEIIIHKREEYLNGLNDYTLKTGLGGLLFYIYNRIIQCKEKEAAFLNDTDFCSALYQLTQKAYVSENVYESIDIFLSFKACYEKKECLRDDFLNASDVFLFPDFKGDNLNEWPVGLKNGCAGVGMYELENSGGIE